MQSLDYKTTYISNFLSQEKQKTIIDRLIKEKSLPRKNIRKTQLIKGTLYTHAAPLPSLLSHLRGSYTVETALVLPFLAAFLTAILFLFRVMQVEAEVQEALSYSCRKSASLHELADNGLLMRGAAHYYFYSFLDGNRSEDYVLGGKKGILLYTDTQDDGYIQMKAVYQMKLPISFMDIGMLSIQQSAGSRLWDYEISNQAEYVYVTPNGEAYHSTKECECLDLSVQCVKFDQIGELRNKDRSKYHACSCCAEKSLTGKWVYITSYGTYYHSTLSCSRIKRTVMSVPITEVGERRACEKCW